MQIKIKQEVAGLFMALAVAVILYGAFKFLPGDPPARPEGPEGEVRFVMNPGILESARIDATYSNGEFDFAYTLTDKGQEWLLEATATNIGKLLLVEMGGVVVSKPVIKDIMGAKKGLVGLMPEHRPLAEALIASLPKPVEAPKAE